MFGLSYAQKAGKNPKDSKTLFRSDLVLQSFSPPEEKGFAAERQAYPILDQPRILDQPSIHPILNRLPQVLRI